MKCATIASALFIAVAIAHPHHGHGQLHHKRAIVTQVDWVTKVEIVTKTVEPSSSSSSSSSSITHSPHVPTKDAEFFEPPSSSTTSTATTSSPSPPPPPPPPPPVVSKAPPPPAAEPAVKPSPKPIVHVPALSPPSLPAVPVAPAAPATAPVSGGGGASNLGQLTYYTLGMGSCGTNNGGQDDTAFVVALSVPMMNSAANGGNPNDNKNCGRHIIITANGISVTATVEDTCQACQENDVDTSSGLFTKLFGSLSLGRADIEWTFAD